MNKRLAMTLLTAMMLSSRATWAKDAKPAEPKVKFPSGYRQWTHSKSMIIFSDKHPLFNAFSGIHHIYINDTALKAAKAHSAYADGSVLVFDLLDADEADGAYSEGTRKLTAVMQKHSKQFSATGGWGFEGFKAGDANQRLVTDASAQCFNCHASRKEHDFVYSEYRE